jgi:hypothetical protein
VHNVETLKKIWNEEREIANYKQFREIAANNNKKYYSTY